MYLCCVSGYESFLSLSLSACMYACMSVCMCMMCVHACVYVCIPVSISCHAKSVACACIYTLLFVSEVEVIHVYTCSYHYVCEASHFSRDDIYLHGEDIAGGGSFL